MICYAVLALAAAQAEVFAFRPSRTDMVDFVTPYRPLPLELSGTAPAGLTRWPKASAPRFGSFTIGSKSAARRYFVLLDGEPGREQRMFLDSNHNGDLTDDPPLRVAKRQAFVGGEVGFQYEARGTAEAPFAGGTARIPVQLNDWPTGTAGNRAVSVTLPRGTSGRVAFGGGTYDAALFDVATSGDYTNPGSVWLRVDVNRNGRFDRRGERFLVGHPFNVGGRTYEADVLSADGSRLSVRLSTKAAPMVLPPPALRAGEKLEPFEAKTIDGRTLRFPEDFRGKTVLLDFGTTWRSAWERGLPVMGKLRDELGVEVVEIALDKPEQRTALDEMLKKQGVTWPVVLQQKGWQDELAQKYGIIWAPVRILVDGWTSRLLVDSANLENATLVSAVAKALGKPIPVDLRDVFELRIPSDVKDVALYRELARRFEVDQAGRQLWSLGFADFMFEKAKEVDHDNTAFVKRLLRQGWPGTSRVGKEGSGYVWILIQHADDDKPFQAQALKIMKPAVAAGEASGTHYAYLMDRVLVGQGKKQLYGTQMKVIDNTLEPYPIEDPENVDKRRKEMGMGTLRDYMEQGFKQFGYKIKTP